MYYAFYLIDKDEKGIVKTWDECQKICQNQKSRYMKFKLKKEAQEWLNEGANYSFDIKQKMKDSLEKDVVYFDAGTGRGNGVEVKISDYYGNSLLGFILPSDKLNEFGNYYLDKNRTNNFGELTGLYAAIKYSLKYGMLKIAGDSNLVIEYWSKGIYNLENIDEDTVNLIKKVTELRKEFENKGGVIYKVSGDINPADLGFHK